MELYFNTVNKNKIREVEHIFSGYSDYELHFLNKGIIEVLSNNIQEVIKNKAISAYRYWKLPIIVEHGALEIEYFNKFPGALSKPMWDLMNDKICSLIPAKESRAAKVISAVCYCDGKKIHIFKGETTGNISDKGRGINGFQFDPIFIPNGDIKTYAEMDISEKMSFSQASKSYGQLITFLKTL